MTAESSSQSILQELHDESGKPVIVQSDPEIQGHAIIKLAIEGQQAHVLRYKPAYEAVRPYLVAFQCGFALRKLRTGPKFRFDVARTAAAGEEAEALVQEHLRSLGKGGYLHLAPQLTQQFLTGLGTQLRSMPISLHVDDWIFQEYPDLRELQLQRQSIAIQLQEAMQALGPEVKAIAPREIVAANVAATWPPRLEPTNNQCCRPIVRRRSFPSVGLLSIVIDSCRSQRCRRRCVRCLPA